MPPAERTYIRVAATPSPEAYPESGSTTNTKQRSRPAPFTMLGDLDTGGQQRAGAMPKRGRGRAQRRGV
jgi:hypothetical protein